MNKIVGVKEPALEYAMALVIAAAQRELLAMDAQLAVAEVVRMAAVVVVALVAVVAVPGGAAMGAQLDAMHHAQ